MAFRIGRKHAQHTYPEAPRGAGPFQFARNLAAGPGRTDVPVSVAALPAAPSAGTPVFTLANNSLVEAGVLTADGAPITPSVTGIIRVSGVVNVENTGADGPVDVAVFLAINGTVENTPVAVATLDAATSFESIPVLFDLPAALPLGTTAHINLVVLASVTGVVLSTGTAATSGAVGTAPSTMSLEEITPATA